jgi:hypothetical protein
MNAGDGFGANLWSTLVNSYELSRFPQDIKSSHKQINLYIIYTVWKFNQEILVQPRRLVPKVSDKRPAAGNNLFWCILRRLHLETVT